MSFDPHHNVFYFYRGPKSKKNFKDNYNKDVDIQLENNTTKALINTLYYSDPNVCKDFLSHFLDIDINTSSIQFALQKQTIGDQKIQSKTNKILWGICPHQIFTEENITEPIKENIIDSDNQSSVPDAWIWDKNNVILIESKTRMKFDKDQLKRHEHILSSPTDKIISFWEEIHAHFKEKLQINHPEQKSKEDLFLIKQFVEYLELINLSKFSGWKKEDFEFFFLHDESEKIRLKDKMEKFASEILSHNDIANILELGRYGKVHKDKTNIWCELDLKDPKFKLRGKDYHFLNFTFELYSNHFQVSIVFPVFPSIKKLKRVLNEKKDQILSQFRGIFGDEINQNYDHDKLVEIIKDKDILVQTIPNYKVRVFDHHFINIGNRHWIPKAEITIDPQTLSNNKWLEFLEQYISIYHPNDAEREKNWGAGLHILKEYPRGCEILDKPEDLIKDVQETLLNYNKFVQTFVN